jgi:hypothetical protein
VSLLSAFPVGGRPAAAAATNMGDVVVPAAPGKIVSVGPNGQQKAFPVTLPGGAFGIGPIGIAYDLHHQLYAALPAAFGPPPSGTPGILKISSNGKGFTPVPGSEGMVAADGMGLDSATGYLYVTDIFGGAIWRVTPGGGSDQLWTSNATNPILGDPDGVKVFNNAVYASSGDRILRIPLNPNGTAGTATVWAQVPGAFFDDMVIDDRTRAPVRRSSARTRPASGRRCSRSRSTDAMVGVGAAGSRPPRPLDASRQLCAGRVRQASKATTSAIAATTVPKVSNVEVRPMWVTAMPARTAGIESDA